LGDDEAAMSEPLWSVVAEDLKQQIATSGESICHSEVIGQVLRERIIGTVTSEKYAAALVILNVAS
jgi:hypothetical protein